MSEYFGKSGMSVSVEVFITKSVETYCKYVYLPALDKCDQGALETICIAEKVLEKFSIDHPSVENLFVKTDNAGTSCLQVLFCLFLNTTLILGSYHSNGIPECLYKIAQKFGITIKSYDFNEAQLVSESGNSKKRSIVHLVFRVRINATEKLLILKTVQRDG